MAKVISIRKERTVSFAYQSSTISVELELVEGEKVSEVSDQAEKVIDLEVEKMISKLKEQALLVDKEKASLELLKVQKEEEAIKNLPTNKEEALEVIDEQGEKLGNYSYQQLQKASEGTDLLDPITVGAKILTGKLQKESVKETKSELETLLNEKITTYVHLNGAKGKKERYFRDANDRELEFMANEWNNGTPREKKIAKEILRLKK